MIWDGCVCFCRVLNFFMKDKWRLYLFLLCWIVPMALKCPLQLQETHSLLKYIKIIVQSLCQIMQNHRKGRKHTVKVKVCCNQRLLVFCQNSASCVYQQKIFMIQMKNPCSLANHLSVILDSWAVRFCCLQSNL